MHRRAWLAFLLVSVVWGMPYLLIKLSVVDMSPLFVAWGRVALGALVVVPLAWRMGALKGLWRHWPAVAAYGALEIAIPFALIPVGEVTVSSSLAAIIVSCLPLLVAMLTLIVGPREPLTPVRAIGLVVGLVGVVLLTGWSVSGRPAELIGALCIGAATLCYACAPIVVARWLRDLHPLGPVAGGLTISTVALAPFALVTRPVEMPSVTSWASLAALGVVCTAVALVLYFYLIAQAGPGRASIITYLNPAVAVVLGIMVLGESVTVLTVAELLLIVAGSWLSTDGRLPPGGLRAVRTLLAALRRRRPQPPGPAAEEPAPISAG
jgi:drug/metabolite transporter (DMT)-like permease